MSYLLECQVFCVFAIRGSSQRVESNLLVSINIFYESLYKSSHYWLHSVLFFVRKAIHLVKCSPTLDGYSQEQQRSFRVRKSRVHTHVGYVPPGKARISALLLVGLREQGAGPRLGQDSVELTAVNFSFL